jgi:hypothetical protein
VTTIGQRLGKLATPDLALFVIEDALIHFVDPDRLRRDHDDVAMLCGEPLIGGRVLRLSDDVRWLRTFVACARCRERLHQRQSW